MLVAKIGATRSPRMYRLASALLAVLLALAAPLRAEFKPVEPKPAPAGCIETSAAGRCDQAGKTYVLPQDIRADSSALFLASNVTLDLNGHTVTYAGAPANFKPFRFGWWKYAATGVEFAGNKFEGCEFGIEATDVPHSFTRK
jgi:hypothetical protein